MGAGMELVFGKHAGQSKVSMRDKARGLVACRKCQSTFRVRGDKLMIPNHTTIQVRSSE